jgi:ParB-like chromosome segregation protein Spo0J
MTTDIDTTVKRHNMFVLDPRLIQVDPETMGRPMPGSDYDVKLVELAVSMHRYGQVQPVAVRNVGGQYVCVAGNRRTQAAQLIVTGFVSATGEMVCDPEFRLKAVTVTGNEEDSFIRNIVENRVRLDTTPMDDALNIQKAIDLYSWTEQECAEHFSMDVQTVRTRLELLKLSKKERQLLADSRITLADALKLAALAKEDRKAALAAASVEVAKPNGSTAVKVDAKVLRESVATAAKEQNAKIDAGEAYGKKIRVNVTRSLKDLKVVLRNQDPGDAVKDFIAAVIGYTDGTVDEDALAKATTKLDNAVKGK